MLNLRFDQPAFLLLGLLVIPLLVIGWRAMSMSDHLRRGTALGLRAALLLIMTFLLAGPHMLREHDHMTVIGLLDISGSVQRFGNLPAISELAANPDDPTTQPQRRSNIEYLRNWFRQAAQLRESDDRFGLVVFDGKAIAISAPTRGEYVDDNLDIAMAQGTNIAEAVRLGLALFPPDTAKRLVLVSDGNQTAGDVLEAIKGAAGAGVALDSVNPMSESAQRASVPVDVLPIAYHITGDVQVARIEAPPTAQPGQTVTVRIILEAASPTSGRLSLKREGLPVDLNGNAPGTSRALDLPAGQSVHLAQVELGHMPINRFEAVFETDNPADDLLPDNDRAEAFTATPSKGSVLVVNARAGQIPNGLAELLNAADIPAQGQIPAQLPDDLLSLQNYDLVVLDNVSAAELSATQQQMLSKYVNDLGGGLIMTGGENSFGAGGWNGTIVEELLPLELDPSKELRLPTAALVLVLDKSGSMNQSVAGARASQQDIANEGAALAIESLRSDNLIGVVTFDSFAHTVIPLQPNNDPKALAQRVRNINADGGTNMGPGLQKAFNMLRDAKADKKRIVCMSDGRSQSTAGLEDMAREMSASGIQISTIAVGDDADEETLRKLADVGGGEFYAVRDPRTLPRVLVDSVQIINRPLIKEGPFTPRVLPTGSTLTLGMEQAPQLGGLVITTTRKEAAVTIEMLHPDGEPLLAHWQAGLGRVAAFTSEAPGAGAWSSSWLDWPIASSFWVQLARTISRPATSRDAELLVTIQDDRLKISYEAAPSEDESPANSMSYLQVEGVIYRPDGTSASIRLRQTAPGRYEATSEASLAGNYIAVINPRRGAAQLSPTIGGASRSTSPEFRKYQSNLGLLEEIVEKTRGRRLDVHDPKAQNLFDRQGMPPSVSSLPMWRTLLFWALALLLLDVASRRIAWDANLLRSLARRAIARVTPAHVRGGRAAQTLATLRRVSDQVDQRHGEQVTGIKKFETTGRIAPPPLRDLAATSTPPSASAQSPSESVAATEKPAAPDHSRINAALDAFLGRTQPSAPAKKPEQQSPPPDGDAASQTTSGLLAAKRRARQQMNPDDPDKP